MKNHKNKKIIFSFIVIFFTVFSYYLINNITNKNKLNSTATQSKNNINFQKRSIATKLNIDDVKNSKNLTQFSIASSEENSMTYSLNSVFNLKNYKLNNDNIYLLENYYFIQSENKSDNQTQWSKEEREHLQLQLGSFVLKKGKVDSLEITESNNQTHYPAVYVNIENKIMGIVTGEITLHIENKESLNNILNKYNLKLLFKINKSENFFTTVIAQKGTNLIELVNNLKNEPGVISKKNVNLVINTTQSR